MENQFFNDSGVGRYAACDNGINGTLSVYNFSQDGRLGKKPIGEIENARFPYLYKSNDGMILLSAVDYDIYLREYSRFSDILDGLNILDSKTLNGDSNGYNYMWNAGICEIEDGYMMLVESGNKEGQEDVKLTTWISEDLDFSGDEQKNATIEKGGNP